MSTFQTFDQASRDMHQAWAPDADTAESPYDIERIDFALLNTITVLSMVKFTA